MELRHLRYFIAVAEELHFNRAAERLHIQQPPLSAQIRALEREMNVRLFERTTRSVMLTEAGHAFLPRAREILESVDGAVEKAQRAAKGMIGELRVGFSGTATYSMLPPVAAMFRQAFPDASLVTQGELLAAPLADALLHRRLDVCLGRLRYAIPELDSFTVVDEELSVLLPASHHLADRDGIDLADLADDDFVGLHGREGSAIFELTIEACRQSGFFPRIVQEASQTATLVCMVAGGFGVALAPESVRHLTITGAVHRRLATPRTMTPLQVIWRKDNDSPLLQQFLDRLREPGAALPT